MTMNLIRKFIYVVGFDLKKMEISKILKIYTLAQKWNPPSDKVFNKKECWKVCNEKEWFWITNNVFIEDLSQCPSKLKCGGELKTYVYWQITVRLCISLPIAQCKYILICVLRIYRIKQNLTIHTLHLIF